MFNEVLAASGEKDAALPSHAFFDGAAGHALVCEVRGNYHVQSFIDTKCYFSTQTTQKISASVYTGQILILLAAGIQFELIVPVSSELYYWIPS